MLGLRRIPGSQYRVVAKEMVMFFIINDELTKGQPIRMPKPDDMCQDPPSISKPAFPSVTQSSLKVLQPGIFFVEFACDKHCRTFGICVHYQFVIGSKRCADGLVCQRCKEAVDEQAIKATRKCPLHFRANSLKPVGSRPEDFLATNEQFNVCSEILRRSFNNEWADLDLRGRGQARVESAGTQIKREQTPKTIQDVRKLNEDGAHDSGYSSMNGSFHETDPRYSGLHNSLLTSGVGYTQFEAEYAREEAAIMQEYQALQGMGPA